MKGLSPDTNRSDRKTGMQGHSKAKMERHEIAETPYETHMKCMKTQLIAPVTTLSVFHNKTEKTVTNTFTGVFIHFTHLFTNFAISEKHLHVSL